MDTKDISIDDFDYPLPESKIALHPSELRDGCKLLVRQTDGNLEDKTFNELVQVLSPETILVVNNTKVINARLKFRKGIDGARIEVFCLEPYAPVDYDRNFASKNQCEWRCFIGNSKKWKNGTIEATIKRKDGSQVIINAERVSKEENSSIIRFTWNDSNLTFSDLITLTGEIPIPPYLNRESEARDSTDYQTVYSKIEGSVAAPTAGLHFTDKLFETLNSRGIEKRELTLHVGAGTFQPVKAEKIGSHKMHTEFISIDRSLIAELAVSKKKIIAVGTTSVRTLESLFHLGRMALEGKEPNELKQWYAYEVNQPISREQSMAALLRYMDDNNLQALTAETQIMIAPGYKFMMIDGMLTNFHQPKSTLLLLISAFIGDDWREAYNHALTHDYRFLSYGDAMLLL